MPTPDTSQRAPLKIVLSGYYGFGNAGDEAVLAGLVKALRARGDEVAITALSIDPAETTATHGIAAAHRYRAGELLGALSGADLLLSGGGSLLQDVTSAHGIFYYAGVIRLAQMLGKKTMLVAQGIGPLNRPMSRRLVAGVASRADAITVRDQASADLLRAIGVTAPAIEVTADPALLLGPDAIVPGDPQGRFAVALRPWPLKAGAIDELLADACREPLGSLAPIGIAMQPAADGPLTEQFLARWHQITEIRGNSVPPWESIPLPDARSGGSRLRPQTCGAALPDLVESLLRADITIGMRLHALILAAACGVPSVGLTYDPKVAGFMNESGQGDAAVDLTNPDLRAALGKVITQVWNTRAERAEGLRRRLPELRAAAQRNGDIALGLLRK
jgi:polysaccharide pyruvyl transferase CsaB